MDLNKPKLSLVGNPKSLKKLIKSKSELFTDLDKEEDFILLTIGAGDIDLWVNDIFKYLYSK